MIRIFFRFDDPSEISDHELEKKILAIFSNYQAKICFAVIPFKKKWRDDSDIVYTLTEQRARHMIEGLNSGVIEIALHGYSHVVVSKTKSGQPSEFFDVSYESQLNNIKKAKDHLFSIFRQAIKGFVPPFNTYDANTLQALNKNNFEYLSASWDTPVLNSGQEKITILPRTCNLNSLRQALDEAENYKQLSPVIGVVLHHDEFEEHIHAKSCNNRSTFTNLKKLDELLKFISQHNEMETYHLSEVCQKQSVLYRLKHISNHNWINGMHWRFRHYFPNHLLLTNSKIKIVNAVIKNSILS